MQAREEKKKTEWKSPLQKGTRPIYVGARRKSNIRNSLRDSPLCDPLFYSLTLMNNSTE